MKNSSIDAYQLGWKAYSTHRIQRNPYPNGSMLNAHWRSGWRDAEAVKGPRTHPMKSTSKISFLYHAVVHWQDSVVELIDSTAQCSCPDYPVENDEDEMTELAESLLLDEADGTYVVQIAGYLHFSRDYYGDTDMECVLGRSHVEKLPHGLMDGVKGADPATYEESLGFDMHPDEEPPGFDIHPD